MIRRVVRFLDSRSGTAPLLRRTLRYLFPDHWSFLLGEVALYLFLLLVATGVYLTFFFDPSTSRVIYHGSYEPLRGASMSHAYKSVVDLSLDVEAGLLIRQTHHWAANLFVAAIVLHLLRIFFTGAFRKPRDLTYWIGLTMLMLAVLEGYIGYSMVDDLLSGMGLAIGYSVALSIPFVGMSLGNVIWGGPFPGDPSFWSRMYIAHVLLIPIAIGTLLAAHLALVALRHHTQFRRTPRRRLDGAAQGAEAAALPAPERGTAQTERRLVGVPTFPGQAPRSLALMIGTFGVLFLLGGLVQINPIWLWGPYHVGSSTNGAQPDWYLGWLIGALRLVPGFDVVVGDYTPVPNPFWGGALFPLVVFGILFAWPWAERRVTGDRAFHNLLERPRDNPWRTGVGVGLLAWVLLVFVAGAVDRSYVFFGITYESQIRVFRALVLVVPPVALFVAKRVCEELLEGERVERIRKAAEREAPLAP